MPLSAGTRESKSRCRVRSGLCTLTASMCTSRTPIRPRVTRIWCSVQTWLHEFFFPSILSPVHTSFECKCNTNFDITNFATNNSLQLKWAQLLRNIHSENISVMPKFLSHLHWLEVWTGVSKTETSCVVFSPLDSWPVQWLSSLLCESFASQTKINQIK